MRIFFSILSSIYIFCIFSLADSSVVSTLSSFNPYSLLHIPLYGILTVLLIFSFFPIAQLPVNSLNQRNQTNEKDQRNQIDQRNPINSTNPINSSNLNARLMVIGFIALIVAIADEIYQAYIPGRDASVTDVLLDLLGIILVLFFAFRLFKTKTYASTH